MSTHSLFHYNIEVYQDYLHDESRFQGCADSISFPETEEEIAAVLDECCARKRPVTIQGARTGITGGAVPLQGHILNLSRMTGIGELQRPGEGYRLKVQPGVVLSTLQELCAAGNLPGSGQAERLFFAPDPTETSATLGGMAATNASGAKSLLYGATREHITGLRLLLPGLQSLYLSRGRERAQGWHFRLETAGSRALEGELPRIAMPQVKNAAGYFIKPGMDLLDLVIGSEGTLGVISELTLRLQPLPGAIWGITAFFPQESAVVPFITELRREQGHARAALAALEYFNSRALRLLADEKETNPAFATLPAIPGEAQAALYLEYHADAEAQLEEAASNMVERLIKHGGREEDTWFAATPREMKPLTQFRHAVPEIVNLKIAAVKKRFPDIAKLGTDMAVPDAQLCRVLAMYEVDLESARLESVIFGHIGNNHLHVNILPADPDEYAKGQALYRKWAYEVAALGGTVSAEHGIGKMKTGLLKAMYQDEELAAMFRLKALFDPENLLNPGNIFSF